MTNIDWSGLTWMVRPESWGPGPGVNPFAEKNVAVVDGKLRLSTSLNPTRCAEVVCSKTFGYGRYEFGITSDVSRLDAYLVLGLYTYGNTIPGAHNEIDIEVAKWGNAGDPTNAQLLQQPFNVPANIKRITIPPKPPYIGWWDWSPGKIKWGMIDGAGTLIGAHEVATTFKPAGEQLCLNLWLADGFKMPVAASVELSHFKFYTPGTEPGQAPPTPAPPVSTTIKENDRVKINHPTSIYHGQTGVVTKVGDKTLNVRLDQGRDFTKSWVVKI